MVDYKPCMVSDSGGFDDKSFNQAGYEGLTSVSTDLGMTPATAESKDANEYAPNIDAMLAAKCNLIITVGFNLADATKTAAEANPGTNFAIIDCSTRTRRPSSRAMRPRARRRPEPSRRSVAPTSRP
jgi:basic membrane protein A